MNRFALITGASRGLGAFLASRFWSAGYSLCLVGRDLEALKSIALSFPKKNGAEVVFLVADMADVSSVSSLCSEIRSRLPRLDVLINNAAIHGPIGSFWVNDLTAWRQAIQVDLLAPIELCHAIVPWMKVQGGGSIINLSGGGATAPRPNFSAYGTAKAGLVRFSETLAEEVKIHNIRVNCISPGAMQTAMLAEVLEKGKAAVGQREFSIASKVFQNGGASMESVANLALFLASDESNGITAKLISAVWDDWEHWPEHLDELNSTDIYTLRRIAGRDRGFMWGDK
jgi:NAD(P)-dependent dehydrogenase (short-subunit alcohol dehydrogenase family)